MAVSRAPDEMCYAVLLMCYEFPLFLFLYYVHLHLSFLSLLSWLGYPVALLCSSQIPNKQTYGCLEFVLSILWGASSMLVLNSLPTSRAGCDVKGSSSN